MHPTSMENMRLAKTKIPDLGYNITIVALKFLFSGY